MSNFNKNGWVSLAQICEERQLVIDAETGKKVLRPAYFSSMNAMIEGAFQFARFFEEIHQKGKVYCSISPDVFYFNLKNGAFHFEGEEFLGEAVGKASHLSSLIPWAWSYNAGNQMLWWDRTLPPVSSYDSSKPTSAACPLGPKRFGERRSQSRHPLTEYLFEDERPGLSRCQCSRLSNWKCLHPLLNPASAGKPREPTHHPVQNSLGTRPSDPNHLS